MDIQIGYWRRRIYHWHEHPNPFRGRVDLALNWLVPFRTNAFVMEELRALLSRGGASLFSLDDQAVLSAVAERISTGELQVCGEFCGPLHAEAEVFVEELESVPAISSPPPPAPPPPSPPEEDTFPPGLDPIAAAAVLTKAAEAGAPFCEECEKAKAAPAPAPAPLPPASTFPEGVDTAAIAAALVQASAEGVPFCEECMRARLAQQRELAASGKSE